MYTFDELMDAIELNAQALFALSQHLGEIHDSLDRLSTQDRTSHQELRSSVLQAGL